MGTSGLEQFVRSTGDKQDLWLASNVEDSLMGLSL